ncbi:activity-dependent neuroprotector homeobox protein 2b isoform X2 [Engraulis encrasicolus]|uniref:activity-dependent neuroprotector homeobox protein 2b isoform X2 n=1 Tax=Engraulis encrasicolus TaxID=184585 RepID=UPI002FD6E9AD
MYQNPVLGLEKIRRSRKNVKSILSDFGLEICQELIEHDLQDVSSDEDEIDDTEWTDLTVGFNGRQKKKWKYRTQTLCCSLCKYTARSWSSYHHHIKVYHPEEKHLTYLSACSACPFIAHPRLVKKHFALFHHDLSRSAVAATGGTTVGSGSTTGDSGLVPVTSAIAAEKYLCRKCGFEDTLLYCMKKHVLFKHAINLWQTHAGQRAESQQKALACSKFYCKTCGANSETTEHLVYHLLTSDKHKDIGRLVLGLIWQKMRPRRAEERQGQGQTFYVANANTSSALAQEAAASAPLLALSSSANSSLQASLALPSGAVLPGLGTTPSTLLPAQHAALVQLASAEAKGLIRVDGPASLSGAQVMSTSSAAAAQQVQRAQQTQLGMVVGPPGHGQPTVQQLLAVRRPVPVQSASGAAGSAGAGAKALVHRPSATPQATVLTSQSLLSHLVPTGNKVNGMPTYTLAPLQMNMAGVQANKGSVVSKLPLQSNASLSQSPFAAPGMDPCKTKKWTSCSLCRELFPSSVFDKHMETHRLKTKNGLAAKAPFLKKMPDRTVKCLTCKVLLSERGIFEHMKHGLMCLYCPKMFNSIKALAFHVKSDHHNVEKEHGDFMRREYKLYTDEKGNLLFPYFDISTTASKDMLGDQEVHLALVTTTKDLLFIKMSQSGDKVVCSAATTAATKSSLKHCPFCGEDTLSAEDQRMHLREKHFITPTIHAILKTPAYKCVFCGGVYTGKTTMMAIIVHLQRCKAAPKTPLDAERLMSSTVVARSNGGGGVRQPATTRPQQPLSNKHLSNKKLSPAAAAAPGSLSAEPVSEVEAQRARRLEMAVKEAMMANKREREARAAKRKLDREQRRSATPPSAASGSGVGQAEALIDPSVPLALNPAGMWKRTFEERREFLTRYFHVQPYLNKKEMTAILNFQK